MKDISDFQLVGRSIARLDTPLKVDGSAQYGIDLRVPGMLFSVIARCPVYGGTADSYDASATLATPGVKQVIPLDGIGIAVVAETTWAALKGRQVLNIRWNEGSNANLDSAAIARMLDDRKSGPAVADRNDGDVAKALPSALDGLAQPIPCHL